MKHILCLFGRVVSLCFVNFTNNYSLQGYGNRKKPHNYSINACPASSMPGVCLPCLLFVTSLHTELFEGEGKAYIALQNGVGLTKI